MPALVKVFLLGRIANDVEHFTKEVGMGFPYLLDQILAGFDDHKIRTGSMHLVGHVPSGISQAADNEVAGCVIDSLLHSASPEWIGVFEVHKECGYHGEDINGEGHSNQDHADVEYPKERVMAGVDDF